MVADKNPEDVVLGFVLSMMLQKALMVDVASIDTRNFDFARQDLSKTRYLVVVLSRGVTENPFVAQLVGTVYKNGGVDLMTINTDPGFTFPTSEWYERCVAGYIFQGHEQDLGNVSLQQMVDAYTMLFTSLSMRFTPH